ncbi:ribonuclease K3-like [Enhydra lutris kenyoni]|uniref:Ribonuclease K3-like n=1 Tax=Enhydra lutris kenyoni TaxID=391180 RepID=A0A2Y9L0X3_ENHLU|nr:ribonuclease K3-like [Enhydra lutris kenyoni]
MMLDFLGPFPLLLLLLGSWGLVHPLCHSAQPSTSVQTFTIQHLRASPAQCNSAMRLVNNPNWTCIGQNSFLQDSILELHHLQNVTITCSWPNRTCRPHGNNCHQSANPTNTTSCYHTGGRYPDCSYSTTPQNRFYVVAWDPRQPGYPPNRLTPVGLDKD